MLRCKKGEIKLYFMHYNSFAEAEEKWNERAKRVNLNNLFFLFEIRDDTEKTIIDEFMSIENENKVIIKCDRNKKKQKGVFVIKIDRDYENGLILKYKRDYLVKRWLDEFDYVSFLNEK